MTPIPSFDQLGLPAPLFINLILKVFGFWIHWFFMGMWFSGLLVALLLIILKSPNLSLIGSRILKTMPIFVAFGVNAGIVPLLFIQVLFPNFFYTSTVFQAWFWFFVIALVLVAYYGIYYFIFNFEKPKKKILSFGVGLLSSAIFLFVGLIFSSEMKLMVSPDSWSINAYFGPGGTIKGTMFALSIQAILRYLIVFGLSTMSFSAYILFDNHFISRKKQLTEDVKRLFLVLMIAGITIFGLAGLKYLGYINPYLENFILWKYLPGIVPALTLILGFLYYLKPSRVFAIFTFIGALLSLLFNSISRQIVQIKEIEPFLKMEDLPLRVQISPILLFIVTLTIGLFVLAHLLKVFFIETRRKNALQNSRDW